MAQTIQERREQFHLARLTDGARFIEPPRPGVPGDGPGKIFLQQTGDPARSPLLGVQALDNLRQPQAASLAYFDVFWLCAVLAAALVVLVLLMKPLGGREGRTHWRGVSSGVAEVVRRDVERLGKGTFINMMKVPFPFLPLFVSQLVQLIRGCRLDRACSRSIWAGCRVAHAATRRPLPPQTKKGTHLNGTV